MPNRKQRIVLAPAVEGSITFKEAKNICRKIEEDKKRKKTRKKSSGLGLAKEIAQTRVTRVVAAVDRAMAKKKPRKKYKVINYKYGKEIEFLAQNQPINWAELKKIVEKEFAGLPDENLLVMTMCPCPLIVGEDDKQTK